MHVSFAASSQTHSVQPIMPNCHFSIQIFGFINGVDNVNWPPYRDSWFDTFSWFESFCRIC